MTAAAKILKDKRTLLPKNGPVPNRRILVIDDEPSIGEAIRQFLCPNSDASQGPRRSSRSAEKDVKVKDAEFEVIVVDTPEKAIEAVNLASIEGHPFAMGFFDVMLGAEIDGIQLVKQLLSVDQRMFAVFVTAYQDRTVDTIGEFLGEENREKWDYINKPFTEGEILQKARNATSLWDLHRLKEWQEERLSEAHQLLMSNERQTAVAAVGRSVAHEFGNLLTHIVGNAELALENGKAPRMKSALELILKTADTATEILKRFRHVHDPDQPTVKHVRFDLRRVLDEALELLEFQFRKRYIHVTRPKVEAMEVLGSRHALVQVFVNLFINSMHAMPDGGTIHIAMANTPDGTNVVIRDTGPGIPEEIIERATEPMFTTKGKDGSGLGLSICKEIIEIEHGGEMKLQNHIKGGLEITLHLPIRSEEES
jgi:signal transduction histidine kinase